MRISGYGSARRRARRETIIKKRLLILVILFTLAMGWAPERSARADVAPPPAPGLGGLEPFEYQDTNVQMVYERVEIELTDVWIDPEYPESLFQQVNVIAWFMMRNLGSADEQMQAVFPLKSLGNECSPYFDISYPPSYAYYLNDPDSFVIRVDGERVTTTVVTTNYPHQTCEPLWPMEWIAFDVTFPVGRDVLIRVEYHMDQMGRDALQNIDYILETGAGWAGPIGRAYVVFRLPYLATTENILSATTPGYQFLFNEIFWSYENIEPTHQDNILISVIAPPTWENILNLRDTIQTNPLDTAAWRSLADTYSAIAYWHGPNLREATYHQKAFDTYQLAMAANPESAELYAGYAHMIWDECCYYSYSDNPMSETDRDRLLPLLDKALSFDPSNQEALEMLQRIKEQFPDLDYTPPVTFTPTTTPSPTQTLSPSITPSPTITRTPRPTATPRYFYPTLTLRPTRMPLPTDTATPTNASTTVATTAAVTPVITSTAAPTATVVPVPAASTWVAQATSPAGLAVLGGILVLHAAVFAWRRRSRG